MSELYPTGPALLPCRVSIAGLVVEARYVAPPRIAYLVATGQWGVLADTLFGGSEELRSAVEDPDGPIDGTDVVTAAMLLSIRLAGVGDGILGWRAMMHLSGYLIRHWSILAGRLLRTGVDPSEGQLWRVLAAVRSVIDESLNPEQRAWFERFIEHPLPEEPSVIPGAGSLDAVRRRSARDFARASKELS